MQFTDKKIFKINPIYVYNIIILNKLVILDKKALIIQKLKRERKNLTICIWT